MKAIRLGLVKPVLGLVKPVLGLVKPVLGLVKPEYCECILCYIYYVNKIFVWVSVFY